MYIFFESDSSRSLRNGGKFPSGYKAYNLKVKKATKLML